MRFLCLVHASEAVLDSLSEDEAERLDREALAYDEVLKRSGRMVVAHALRPPSEALCLRSRGGRIVATDGPHAETKEQLLGFILIEAESREEAARAAEKIPCGRYGTVELREVRYLDGEMPDSP